MGKVASSNRPVWRLAVVGVVWAFVVISVAGFFAANRGRGRLPDLSATRSPSRPDARLAHVVSVLAGRGVTVLCWSHEDWRKEAAEQGRRFHTTKLGGPWAAFTSFSPYLAV